MTAEPISPSVAIDPPSDAAAKMLNRVLSLASKGYFVFPVRITVDADTGENTKTYLTRAQSPDDEAWGATRDDDAIRAWWGPGGQFTGRADVMIGIATGPSGVVLIDLDVKKGEDGPSNWKRLHPDSYPFPAAIGHSSTGGTHLAYRADPKRPVRTTAGIVAAGVDTRGIGGMFVCWSKWLPAVSELPKVPAFVPEVVPKLADPGRPEPLDAADLVHLAPADEVQARVVELAVELAAAPDGMGNDIASTTAWKVGGYVGAGQVDRDWALAALLAAFDGWTWRKARDESTMRRTVERQLDAGARFPRPWTAAASPLIVDSTAYVPAVLAAQDVACTPGIDDEQGADEEPAGEELVEEADEQEADEQPEVLPEATAGFVEEQETTEALSEAPVAQRKVAPHLRRLSLVSAATIAPKRVRWTWAGRWATGTIALVAGKQGLGKSTIVYDRVARVTRGELEGEYLGQPRAVLICATEDSWEFTIVPRLIAAGADLTMVYRVDVHEDDVETGLSLPRDLVAVEEAVTATGAILLVLDPLTSRVDAGLDSHKDSETRRALEPLAALADRTRLVVVGLMHLNKSGKVDPMDAIMASTAFTAVARSVSIAMLDPDDEAHRRKLFGTPKNNLGRTDLPTLVFATVGYDVETDEGPTSVGRIEWLGEVEGSIGDAMERATQDPETRTAIGDAAEWLRHFLVACGGSADSMAIKDAGRAEGHNAKTLLRALKKIGGRAESVQNAFPRRTLWAFQSKTDKLAVITPVSTVETTTPQTTKTVLTVSTVSTNGDSEDSRDCFHVTGDVVPTAVPTSEPTSPAGAPGGGSAGPGSDGRTPPSWAVKAREPELFPKPAPEVECPCGRPEGMHTRGNWVTCRAGHVFHGLGFRALETCPQCGDGS